jgi:hypothetical protein
VVKSVGYHDRVNFDITGCKVNTLLANVNAVAGVNKTGGPQTDMFAGLDGLSLLLRDGITS